jgi:hypothetical protein
VNIANRGLAQQGAAFLIGYVRENPVSNGIEEIIKALEAGQHVILSFYQHETAWITCW